MEAFIILFQDDAVFITSDHIVELPLNLLAILSDIPMISSRVLLKFTERENDSDIPSVSESTSLLILFSVSEIVIVSDNILPIAFLSVSDIENESETVFPDALFSDSVVESESDVCLCVAFCIESVSDIVSDIFFTADFRTVSVSDMVSVNTSRRNLVMLKFSVIESDSDIARLVLFSMPSESENDSKTFFPEAFFSVSISNTVSVKLEEKILVPSYLKVVASYTLALS